MQAKTVKQVLVAARWILDNVGWCQGSYFKSKDGKRMFNIREATDVDCVCAMGAILAVETTEELQSQALDLVNDLIVENHYTRYIANWNDESGRTKQQVLKMMDKAIERAR